ncbi:cation-transporting P-type ATPase [Burkholderia sp. 9120]|jgi:H+-transporting ATPase|uniref:cation-transporting P-type ATPase n=1 Tax=Burkholderia sp. 9120 TaxID=1500897 RepID=UPI0009DEF3DF|nr:cation-transporting P-type ATPase [Burkholderia sp. 9120]
MSDTALATPAPAADKAAVSNAPAPGGLSSSEARQRLAKSGPNAISDTSVHPLRTAIAKFRSLVPWTLEAAIVLQLVPGKYVEEGIVAGLQVLTAWLASILVALNALKIPICRQLNIA